MRILLWSGAEWATHSCYLVLRLAGGMSAISLRKNEVSRRYASLNSNFARVHDDSEGPMHR